MQRKTALRISIIIPVYNEADHLGACLDAIAGQTVRPYEVIVVDNNSSDDSVVIAKRYSFVRVVQERRQGVVYARNTGFNQARGDIIGRIDADTIMESDWVQKVRLAFRNDLADAISGRIEYYDLAQADVVNAIDLYFRRYFARRLGREVALQGANMAMSRSAWEAVRNHVCKASGLHEDFDLAVHLTRQDKRVMFWEPLTVGIGFRQTDSSWKEFARYALISPRTYARHGLTSQRCMYPVVMLAVTCYVPLRILHRGYDGRTGRFSFRHWLRNVAPARVNPATFVD